MRPKLLFSFQFFAFQLGSSAWLLCCLWPKPTTGELPLIVSVWASPLLVLIKCETIKAATSAAAAAAVYVVNRAGVTTGGVWWVTRGHDPKTAALANQPNCLWLL